MFPTESVETDVLVIGGGIAGARAAVEAVASDIQVTLITKGIYASGTSVGPVVCAAVGPWSTREDSKDLHFEGMVASGRRFLCEQEFARILADEAPDRVLELENFGLLWDRDAAGNIEHYPDFIEEVRLPTEPARYFQNRQVSSRREGMYYGYTGRNVLDVLRDESLRRGVKVMEETTAVQLLMNNGHVVGALALDYVHGKWYCIKASAVIVATGSISQLWYPWGLGSREMTGDGIAMAYQAGAVISDLELMMTAYLPTVSPAWSGRHKLLQSVIEYSPIYKKEYQTRWLNALGEPFLNNYPPAVPHTYEELYLKVIKGVQTELEEGRGPLYIDYGKLPKAFLDDVAPFLLRMMDKLGRPEGEYKLEVGPNPMWSFGGIKINNRCETSVPGLYACADAANCIKDGLGAAVACGVTTCLVFGARAGQCAAEFSKTIEKPNIEFDQFEETIGIADKWTHRSIGVSPLQVKIEIGKNMQANLHLRNETRMLRAQTRLREIRDELLPALKVSSDSPRYNYELVEAYEIRNMLDIADMFVAASLMRKESRRHMFIREDYPLRDDKNWLKHILIRENNGRMELNTIPVDFKYFTPDDSGLQPRR